MCTWGTRTATKRFRADVGGLHEHPHMSPSTSRQKTEPKKDPLFYSILLFPPNNFSRCALGNRLDMQPTPSNPTGVPIQAHHHHVRAGPAHCSPPALPCICLYHLSLALSLFSTRGPRPLAPCPPCLLSLPHAFPHPLTSATTYWDTHAAPASAQLASLSADLMSPTCSSACTCP